MLMRTAAKPKTILTRQILIAFTCCLFALMPYSPAIDAATLINHSTGGDINDTGDYHYNDPTFSASSEWSLLISTDKPRIRILFLYIDTVRARYSIDDIDVAISNLIQQTNNAYKETGIEATVESAHVGAWPFDNDSQLAAMTALEVFTELNQWMNSALWAHEGLMHQYNADAVFLVDIRDNNDNFCGWANIDTKAGLENKDSSNSYGLIRLGSGCGVTAAILAHELGHLLGSAHGYDNLLTSTSPIGHGIICDGRSTIMHPSFPKHLIFSNPVLLRGGEICGDIQYADNARLFIENTVLLADKQLYPLPSANVTLILNNAFDSSGQLAKVTFYRSGIVDDKAQIQWHYKNQNIQNIATLNGGIVTFEPGEIEKTVDIPTPTFLNSDNPHFLIYLRNPHGVLADPRELLIVGGETIQNPVNMNFLVETNGLTITLNNTSSYATDTDTDTEIVTLRWTISSVGLDYNYQSSESSFSTDVIEAGIYQINLTLIDTEGIEYSRTVEIIVEGVTATTVPRTPTLTEDFVPSAGGGGGSFSFLFIGLIATGLFRKSRRQIKQPAHGLRFI